MENRIDYMNPFLVQSDTSRDSMSHFIGALKKEVGMTLQEFKRIARKEDDEDGTYAEWIYEKNGFEYRLYLEAGDPYYKLYKTEIDA